MPEIRYTVTVDEAGAVQGIRRFTGAAEEGGAKAGTALGPLEGKLSSVGKLAASIGVTFGAWRVVGVLTDAVGAAVDFEKEMANVATLVDTSTAVGTAQFAKMREELLQLPPALGSSTDLARGMYQALSAGVPAANAVKFVGEAAIFAKAALTDTFTSVDVLTSALNAYGLSAENTGRISSTFFKTIELGKVTGQELASTFGRLMPITAAMGITIQEASAALAALTIGGISADEAVTALRQVLVTILQPAKESEKAAKALGLSFEEMRATLRQEGGLQVVMTQLADTFKKNDTAAAELFGNVRALVGALALTGPQAAQYADIQRQVNQAWEDGNRQNVALAKQLDTVSAKWSTLINTADRAIQQTGAIGLIKDALDAVSNAVEVLSTNWQVLVVMLGGVVGAFAVVAAGMASAVLAIVAATAAVVALTGAFFAWAKAQKELLNSNEQLERTAQKAAEVLRTKYNIEISRAGLSLEQWVDKLNAALAAHTDLGPVFLSSVASFKAVGDETKKNTELTDEQKKAIKRLAHEEAEYIRKQKDTVAQLKFTAEARRVILANVERLIPALKTEGQVLAELTEKMNREVDAVLLAGDANEKLGKFMEKLPGLFNVAGGSVAQLEQAYKDLGVTSPAVLELMAREAEKNFQIILDSGLATTQALTEAWIVAAEARIAADRAAGKVISETAKQALEQAKQDLGEMKGETDKATKEMSKQISTIFTDLSKGIAEAIVEWRGFWGTLKSIGKDLAKTVLRVFIEELFEPLEKWLKKLSDKISDWISRLADKISGFFSKLSGGQLLGLAGIGAGIGVLGTTSGPGGRALGGGLTGAGIGAMIGSAIPGIGTAVGAAVGAAIGAISGAISGFVGRGRKEADKLAPIQNQLTATLASLVNGLNALREAGTLTSADVLNARAAIIQLRDEYFKLTEQFERAGPGARQTIGALVDTLLAGLDEQLPEIQQAEANFAALTGALQAVNVELALVDSQIAESTALLTGYLNELEDLNSALGLATGSQESYADAIRRTAAESTRAAAEVSNTQNRIANLERQVARDRLQAIIEANRGTEIGKRAEQELADLERQFRDEDRKAREDELKRLREELPKLEEAARKAKEAEEAARAAGFARREELLKLIEQETANLIQLTERRNRLLEEREVLEQLIGSLQGVAGATAAWLEYLRQFPRPPGEGSGEGGTGTAAGGTVMFPEEGRDPFGGRPVNITFQITALDPSGMRRVVRDNLIPEIKLALKGNVGGLGDQVKEIVE